MYQENIQEKIQYIKTIYNDNEINDYKTTSNTRRDQIEIDVPGTYYYDSIFENEIYRHENGKWAITNYSYIFEPNLNSVVSVSSVGSVRIRVGTGTI